MRLLRPGALVAGVADGRCVLVRAVPDAGGGAPWIAALEAGLPVPAGARGAVRRAAVLVVPAADGQPLSPRRGRVRAIAGRGAGRRRSPAHGIAVSRLRAGDLVVCDGVARRAGARRGTRVEGDDGAAAFAAMVAAACAPDAVAVAAPAAARRAGRDRRGRGARRRRDAGAVAGAGRRTRRRGAAAAAPAVPARGRAGSSCPVAEPQPPVARGCASRSRRPKAKEAKPQKRRVAAPTTAEQPVRVRPVPPARPPARQRRPRDDVPVAGGDADPLPAL